MCDVLRGRRACAPLVRPGLAHQHTATASVRSPRARAVRDRGHNTRPHLLVLAMAARPSNWRCRSLRCTTRLGRAHLEPLAWRWLRTCTRLSADMAVRITPPHDEASPRAQMAAGFEDTRGCCRHVAVPRNLLSEFNRQSAQPMSDRPPLYDTAAADMDRTTE